MLVFDDSDNLDLSRERSRATVDLSRKFFQVGNRRRSIRKTIRFVVGTNLGDKLIGSNQSETILGGNGDGRDVIKGRAGDDMLFGYGGNDQIVGGRGNDLISGSGGRDVMTGGPGADSFLYTNPRDGRDRITDFDGSEGDQLLVAARAFGGGLTKAFGGQMRSVAIDNSQFVLGSAARDRGDRFIYERRTGILSYDVDGTGSQAAIAIAKFDGSPRLTASDIMLV